MLKRLVHVCLWYALLLVLFACQGRGRLYFFGPKLNWRLAANGLANKGIWKSAPALADVNRDGFLDIGAIARLGDGAHVWLGDGKGSWHDASQGLTMPLPAEAASPSAISIRTAISISRSPTIVQGFLHTWATGEVIGEQALKL